MLDNIERVLDSVGGSFQSPGVPLDMSLGTFIFLFLCRLLDVFKLFLATLKLGRAFSH